MTIGTDAQIPISVRGELDEPRPFEVDARARPESPLEAIADFLASTPEVPSGLAGIMDAPTPQPRLAGVETATTDAPAASEFGLAIERAESGLGALQAEIDGLKAEINLLRRRDETLKFYMLRLDEELRLAARLQQDFLPRHLPQVGTVHFHALFRPAGYVSGDLYDVVRLDEKHVAFCVLDAVGHGMPAALLTMFIKRALVSKEITAPGPNGGYRILPPAETLGRVNDALVEQNLSAATFATAMYGVLNTETLQLTLATGGHPAPLLLRGEQMIDLPTDGPLLGIFPGELFGQTSWQLQPGDRLVVYSDGVEVALGEDLTGDGTQWKQELFLRRALPAEGMIIDFSNHLDDQVGSLSPRDDLTLLVVEIK
jgi:serine phosphatase RsbU (regulator of sigma subunit)